MQDKSGFLDYFFSDDAPQLRRGGTMWSQKALDFAEYTMREMGYRRYEKKAARCTRLGFVSVILDVGLVSTITQC